MYINIQWMLNSLWSLALHLGTTLFIVHIPQATCLDHQNSLYYHNIALIETSSLKSWPNNRIYGENDARKAYQLNLYPTPNRDSCTSQSLVWPSCNFLNFSWNSILWLMNISTRMSNLLNMLSINAYVTPSITMI